MLDGHLREHAFLAGERYSIADISVYAYVHVAADARFDLADYPAVADWVARVEATPGLHERPPADAAQLHAW